MTTYVCLWCPPADITDPAALRADLAAASPEMAAALAEGASPAAALGQACRDTKTPRGTKLEAGRRAGGGSFWFFCDSRRDEYGIEIKGDLRLAVSPSGALDLDSNLPTDVAQSVRERYAHHRTAMTPAQLTVAVAGEVARRRGIAANRAGSAWLVDGAHADDLGKIGAALALHGATLAVHRLAENDGDLYRPTATEALRAEIDGILAAAREARDRFAENAHDEKAKRPQSRAESTQLAALSEAQAKLRQWRDGLRIDLAVLDQELGQTATAVRRAFTAAQTKTPLEDTPEPAPETAPAPEPAPEAVTAPVVTAPEPEPEPEPVPLIPAEAFASLATW